MEENYNDMSSILMDIMKWYISNNSITNDYAENNLTIIVCFMKQFCDRNHI